MAENTDDEVIYYRLLFFFRNQANRILLIVQICENFREYWTISGFYLPENLKA